ncbi:hypothetical protein [Pontibacter sp. G13]|uniref:hypothetical protein n=1 Tax=Pontibacter sp. G13 TaxID=3074898 RepID=UPI00288AAC9C|nr:hypothetical protein [Pontibacter sp. G13]WNJ21055.1 hypothetical protein RJD25_11345 [Pontibacter sp. G13]
MPRKIHIQDPDPDQFLFIGLVSSVRVWTLCYEINRLLGLQLKQVSSVSSQDADNQKHQAAANSLFLDFGNSFKSAKGTLYEDHLSDPERIYVLYEPDRSAIPKPAKAFPYFLILRAASTCELSSDRVIEALSTSDLLTSVVDLSHLKDINNILP